MSDILRTQEYSMRISYLTCTFDFDLTALFPGLNLTAADVCILHDLDFNPFNDIQAEDRCHRIGQKKPVTVIKMVTKGTVDEDIYSVQERKAKMNAAILDEGEGSNKRSKKSSDNEEICRIMNAAVDRFLKSPTKSSADPVVVDD